jgi:hypothetical protein
MKKRRHLERKEALPLVCRLPAYKKWEALGDKIEMVYKQRTYVKGVHGMEDKLLTAMVNSNAKKKKEQLESKPLPAVAEMAAVAAAAKGAAIQYVEGGGKDADEESGSNHGGGDDGHGTDEESKSSNPHPPSNNNGPAISQIDVNGTLSMAISRYHSQQNNSKNDIIIR